MDHREHEDEDRRALRTIARDLDLVVTGSRDHHGLNKQDHDLGCFTTAPEELERLRDGRTPAISGQGDAPV